MAGKDHMNQNENGTWWVMSVIPATWKARATKMEAMEKQSVWKNVGSPNVSGPRWNPDARVSQVTQIHFTHKKLINK